MAKFGAEFRLILSLCPKSEIMELNNISVTFSCLV
jgi:hypothetical protein